MDAWKLQAALLIGAAFSTFFVTAVNAYTLTLGYPLWRFIRAEDFRVVHAEYLRRLNSVITVPHVLMFFSCASLLLLDPRFISRGASLAIALLSSSVVAVSAFIAGPVHSRFSRQGAIDEAGMQTLMRVSVARTIMMLIASVMILMVLAGVFGAAERTASRWL